MTKNTLGWIALNCIPGIGPVLSRQLTEIFGSPAALFSQSVKTLAAQKNMGLFLAQRICGADWEDLGNRELQKGREYSCQIITLEDKHYPPYLRTIPYPPPVLYVNGNLYPEDEFAIAVVGSRGPSVYGISTTQRFVKDLVLAGLTIVSGLARGIDTQAHQTALGSQGRTLAVVAHGLDRVYPPENKNLLKQIVQQGAVISEFPFGMPPIPNNFPRRNRIISGLAQGVLVVEARAKSGALITARWAAEQGKDAFAIPGTYQSALSQGTHALIQDGAKLVTHIDDILQELPKSIRTKKNNCQVRRSEEQVADEHQIIREALEPGARHIDQLAVQCRKSVQTMMVNLLALELQGLVKSVPGQLYQWIGK